MPAEHPPQPAYPAAQPPTAYTARVVATGLAAAAGAMLTSLVDSRGTLAGAMLVAMTVSALGQVMRAPLDRFERRLKGLGVPAARRRSDRASVVASVPAAAAAGRAPRRRGVAGGILAIGLLGFLVGMAALGAREIAEGKGLSGLIVHMLQSRTSIQDPVRLAPATQAAADESVTPTPRPAERRSAATPTRLGASPTLSPPTSPGAAEPARIGPTQSSAPPDRVRAP